MWILYLLFIIIFPFNLGANDQTDSCSRTATINYQEVLVDTNNTNKGEGLRFYLEKDPIAKNYLETYQQTSRPQKLIAAIGAIGSSMLLASLFTTKKQGVTGLQTRDILVIGGTLTLIGNFLVAKTFDYTNEAYLQKSIDEYNKRNFPRIYFGPSAHDSKRDGNSLPTFGITGGVLANF
jgi:hypothetical protein